VLTINSINNKSSELTIDPGASGDSLLQFSIGGTDKFSVFVDDDDSDKFKILPEGAASGALVIESTGEVTKPLQSAAAAYLSATATNVTGISSYTVICDTETFDNNGDYDHTTGIFTAPISGRFLVCGSASLVVNSSTGGVQYDFIVKSSNKTYYFDNGPTRRRLSNYYGSNDALSMSCSVLIDMDASDTVYLTVSSNSGSSDSDDVYGHSTDAHTYFSCYLVS